MTLEGIFDEWNVYAGNRKLLGRDFDYKRIVSNSALKIIAITGIRRGGKSSLLMLLSQELAKEGKKCCYINLEDSRLGKADTLDELLKWFGDEGFMLLDEITNIADWEGWLLRVHEQLGGRLRIVASSSRKSLAAPHKPLRGRMLPLVVYPLSFTEFLSFKGITIERTTVGRGRLEKALFDYLRYGGFPEVVLVNDLTDKINYLGAYFNDIVALDIAEAANENIDIVQKFSRYAIESRYFSASKTLNFFKSLGYKIGKSKLLKLEAYAKMSYMFSFVPIFSYKVKDVMQYPRKVYAGDTGFFYAITGKEDMGMPFENLIFLELERLLREQESIYYWKDIRGNECDFVIASGSRVKQVIQASYDVKDVSVKKREIAGAVGAAKEFGLNEAVIVTDRHSEKVVEDDISITFVPVIDWLFQGSNG